MNKTDKKVLVFGVFDLLHKGHEAFLTQAAALGNELIVAVAPDAIVQTLKQKIPRHNERERISKLRQLPMVTKVVLGDTEIGSYQVIIDENPDCIALGYDQQGLQSHLEDWLNERNLSIPLNILQPFEEHRYKTTLIANTL